MAFPHAILFLLSMQSMPLWTSIIRLYQGGRAELRSFKTRQVNEQVNWINIFKIDFIWYSSPEKDARCLVSYSQNARAIHVHGIQNIALSCFEPTSLDH